MLRRSFPHWVRLSRSRCHCRMVLHTPTPLLPLRAMPMGSRPAILPWSGHPGMGLPVAHPRMRTQVRLRKDLQVKCITSQSSRRHTLASQRCCGHAEFCDCLAYPHDEGSRHMDNPMSYNYWSTQEEAGRGAILRKRTGLDEHLLCRLAWQLPFGLLGSSQWRALG